MSETRVTGNATGKAGLFVRNEVHGGATAKIVDATVTATGAIAVAADESASIVSVDSSIVNSWDVSTVISITNNVLATSKAFIDNSTITKGAGAGLTNDLSVIAKTTATFSARASTDVAAEPTSGIEGSGTVLGVLMAYNSIGWQPQNLLFDAAETIIGSPTISELLNHEQPADTQAYIKNSAVDVAGSVTLDAKNTASIDAHSGAESTMDWTNDFAPVAEFGTTGAAAAFMLASNKVSGSATAYIDNTGQPSREIIAGEAVSVTADNGVSIDADLTVTASAAPASTIDALFDLVGDVAERLGAGSYDYTTNSGIQNINKGDKVRLSLAYLTAEVNMDAPGFNPATPVNIVQGDRVKQGGVVYKYVGAHRADDPLTEVVETALSSLSGLVLAGNSDWVALDVNMGEVYEYTSETPLLNANLATLNYDDAGWSQLRTSDFRDTLFPNLGNVTETNSKVAGMLLAYNDVRGSSIAKIVSADVDADGAVTVGATGSATITSYVSTSVEAGGGSNLNGDGKNIGFAGQIVTNVVLGDTSATIEDSTILSGGDISVDASNDARIDARLYTSASSGDKAIGLALSYNSVGWEAQNVVFNTVDVILGTPYLADNAFDGNVGADAYAGVLNSSLDAEGSISVTADSQSKINSTISNSAIVEATSIKGADGTAFGATISGNKVSGKATAIIDNGDDLLATVEAGAGVSVIANDATGIYSNIKLVVDSTVTNDGGASIIQETLNDLFPADYDTKPDQGGTTKIRDVKFGDRIRLADDYGGPVTIDLNKTLPPTRFPISTGDYVRAAGVNGASGAIYRYLGEDEIINLETVNFGDTAKWQLSGGNAGSIYIYMGETPVQGTPIDLASVNFTDKGFWKEAPEATLALTGLNVASSPSKAVGGVVVLNGRARRRRGNDRRYDDFRDQRRCERHCPGTRRHQRQGRFIGDRRGRFGVRLGWRQEDQRNSTEDTDPGTDKTPGAAPDPDPVPDVPDGEEKNRTPIRSPVPTRPKRSPRRPPTRCCRSTAPSRPTSSSRARSPRSRAAMWRPRARSPSPARTTLRSKPRPRAPRAPPAATSPA